MPTVMMTMILGMRNRDLLGWAIFHPHFPLITLMTQAKRSSDNLAAANKKIYIWAGGNKKTCLLLSPVVWISIAPFYGPLMEREKLHRLPLNCCIL